MTFLRATLIAATLTGLTACSNGLATRADFQESPLLTSMQGEVQAPVPLNPSYNVSAIEVTVPAELTSSEENGIKPRVDILWHEDPLGDRHAQVDELMTAALEEGVAGLNGERAVKLEVVMTRFHALTKRTRYSIGGEHEIWFYMAVRDAKTGELIEKARLVGFDMDISAQQALENEAKGMNQRIEITQAVKDLIQFELTRSRDFLQG